MTSSAEGSGAHSWEKEDLSSMLGRLHLEDEEVHNLIWEDEVDDC